jgi:hypothetical protein
VARALVLELSHSRKLTEHSKAVEHPSKLGVCGNVRLNVKGVLLGVKTASNIESESLAGSSSQLCGNLTDCNGVQVDYAVKAFVIFAVMGKVLDSTEIITYREVSARLNARKANLLIVYHKQGIPFILNHIIKAILPHKCEYFNRKKYFCKIFHILL